MKIRFYCYWMAGHGKGIDDDPYYLFRVATLTEAPKDVIREYNKYLLGSLDTDYPAIEYCDDVLKEIDRLERGEIQTFTWEGDGFFHDITRDTVTFEHAVFGECPEWPIWRCSLTQYKVALEGWKRFLVMPKSIDSELIVDLP